MTLSIELWQLVTVVTTLIGAYYGLAKLLAAQAQKHLDERFNGVGNRLKTIEDVGREEAAQWQRIERDLMNLRAELPISYVRREDYIRGQSVIEAKLDGLAMKLENAQLRGLINGGKHGT